MDEQIREVPAGTGLKTKKYRRYDFVLLALILFFVGLGLVFLYSTSSYMGIRKFGDAAYYLKHQGLISGMSVAFMLAVSLIDYSWYIVRIKIFPIIRVVYLLLAGAYFFQVLVLFIGVETLGAKRWMRLPIIGSFQPSELSKLAIIVLTSFIVSLAPSAINKFTGFIRILIYLGPLIVLVLKEDLSTAIVMSLILVIICFVASKKLMYFIGVAMAGVATVVAYILFGDSFRSDRIYAWLHVDTAEKAYQVRRSLYAISSGGLTGKGLGESSLKLGYLPEAHNDMIFAIICEELGVIGVGAIFLLYVLLLWRIYVIAFNARDLFGSLLCVGVFTQIAAQLIINVAVVTNLIPNTGIGLPFISYGGTSILVLLAEMGMVLSVSYRIEYVEYYDESDS